MEKWKAKCLECGEEFTEVYPDGLDGDKSYEDVDDDRLCDCESEYDLIKRVDLLEIS